MRIQDSLMETSNHRILIIDDNEAIHEDFRKILCNVSDSASGLKDAASALFGEEHAVQESTLLQFEVDSAFQGKEGLEMIQRALAEGRPYAMAFIDVRMPPGWTGIETLNHIWPEYPELQAVVCTAYSDYTLMDMVEQLGRSDRWMVLKKPFDKIEVYQLACALTEKWQLNRKAQLNCRALEQMVAERTTKLENAVQDLATMRETADAANQAKSEFLANMSHEIRTPMTAIRGFAENLLDTTLSERERIDAIQTVRRNSDYLLELINDILDLSKIEAGSLEVEQIPCSIVELVFDVLRLMQVRADAKELPLKIEFTGLLPQSIQTDPTRLRQILINLVGNAIKFTEKGSVRLVVGFAPDVQPPELTFQVIDTGIGIGQEGMSQLFRPFSQADTSTTRKYGGTGLGLAISKKLAAMLGGAITVETQPGQGSTFCLTINMEALDGAPLIDPQADSAMPANEARPTAAVAAPVLSCRVLLAEDGTDNQRLLSFILRKAGAEVEIAENGQQAIELFEQGEAAGGKPFHILLMDMQMPVVDGYEATRQLRELGCRLPIIALTANAMQGDREKCLLAGCDDYLSKPVNRSHLVQLIAKYTPGSTAGNEQSAEEVGCALEN